MMYCQGIKLVKPSSRHWLHRTTVASFAPTNVVSYHQQVKRESYSLSSLLSQEKLQIGTTYQYQEQYSKGDSHWNNYFTCNILLFLGFILGSAALTARTVFCQSKEEQEYDEEGHPCDTKPTKNRGLNFEKAANIEDAIKKVQKLLRREMEYVGAPGLVACVSINGKTVWDEGFGYADIENNVRCTPKTVMRIASISKSLTMTFVAKLWEEGKLDLDAPIQKYIPYFPNKTYEGEEVTITTRQLISHKSGIRHYKLKDSNKKKNSKKANDVKQNEKKKEKKEDASATLLKVDQNVKEGTSGTRERKDEKTSKGKGANKTCKIENDQEGQSDTPERIDEENSNKERTIEDPQKKAGESSNKGISETPKEEAGESINKGISETPKKKVGESSKEGTSETPKKKIEESSKGGVNKTTEKSQSTKVTPGKKKEAIKEVLRENEDKNEKKKKEELDDEFDMKEYYIQDNFASVEDAMKLFKDDELYFKPDSVSALEVLTKYAHSLAIAEEMTALLYSASKTSGNGFLYTTHGWTVVSGVVEGAAGKPFTQVIKRLFHELGLDNTCLDEHNYIIYNRACYYIRDRSGKLQNAPYVDNSYKWAGGGFLSTVGDLTKFGNAMLYSSQQDSVEPSIKNVPFLPGYLKSSTMQQLWTPVHGTNMGRDAGYGLGWVTAEEKQTYGYCNATRQYASHTGGAVGASSVLLILPEKGNVTIEGKPPKGVVVSLITNMQGIGLNKIALQIATLFESIGKEN